MPASQGVHMRASAIRAGLSRRTLLGGGAVGVSAPAGALLYQMREPSFAGAQPMPKIARVGVLNAADPSEPGQTVVLEAFLGRMREHGWHERQNLAVERRGLGGDFDSARIAALGTELFQMP